MIIDFSVENFKSIKEEQTFSMAAVNLRNEHPEHVFSYDKNISLVKTAAIYGANASGKSNLLEALLALRNFIVDSTDLKLDARILYYRPYKLDKNYSRRSSNFEIEFIGNDKIRYKYNISFNEKEVEKEKLVFYPRTQEALLFERKIGENITFGSQLKGRKKDIENQLLPNNLFLSKAANSNHEQLGNIYKYFLYNLNFNTGFILAREPCQSTTMQLARQDNPEFKNKLIDFLIACDTGILSVGIRKNDRDNEFSYMLNDIIDNISKSEEHTGDDIKSKLWKPFSFKPVTYHTLFEDKKETGEAEFELYEESDGTLKMYALAGKLIPVLENGLTLIVDELDTSLHPHLSEYLIELFNSPEKNPNNAQLVFTTHDTSLLNSKLFRRDQVWFAKRNSYGATEFISLDEFDKDEVRKNVPFEKWYLSGRFGAIPKINKNLFEPVEKCKE